MVTPRPVHLGSDARNGRPTPLPHCDNKSLVWSTSDVRVFTSQRQNASDPPRVSECLPPRYKMRLIRLGCPSVYLPETKCVWSASGVRAFTSQRQNASDPPWVSECLPPRDKMRLMHLGCPSVYLPETRCVWCTSGFWVFTFQRHCSSVCLSEARCVRSTSGVRLINQSNCSLRNSLATFDHFWLHTIRTRIVESFNLFDFASIFTQKASCTGNRVNSQWRNSKAGQLTFAIMIDNSYSFRKQLWHHLLAHKWSAIGRWRDLFRTIKAPRTLGFCPWRIRRNRTVKAP